MEAYPRREHDRASLSSVNRGEVREKEGSRGGIMARERRERPRCTEGNAPEWSTRAVDKTGMQSAEGILGRVATGLCADANGRKKTSLAGGPILSATQGSRGSRGDVVQCETFDRDLTT